MTNLGSDPLREAISRLDRLIEMINKSDLTHLKKNLLIADIKIIKTLVVALGKTDNKSKFKEVAIVTLRTIQASIEAFPKYSPDLREVKADIEEEIQNRL